MKKNIFKKIFSIKNVLFAVLLIYALSIILLLLWGFFNSIKTADEFRKNVLYPPMRPTFNNYIVAVSNLSVEVSMPDMSRALIPLYLQLWYSIVYSLGAALSSTFFTCLTAYATAKFPFRKFNAVILNIVIITMILPIVGSLPSALQINKAFGLYNKIWSPIVTSASFLGMYYLVFLAFYKGMPDSFLEAAYIDGASEWQVLWRIIFPLSINMFMTVTLIKFVTYWQDYQSPMIFIPSYPTLAYGVFSFGFSTDTELSSVPMKMTACFILLLPILILFGFFSDKLTGNLRMGGLKG